MHPPNNSEIQEDVLEYLFERFKGREIPLAYRFLSKNPDILKKFIELRDAIMKNGRINPILKEKIAVKVSEINRCELCYNTHKSKLDNTEPENEFEKLILNFAENAAKEKGRVKLEINISDDEAIEVFLVIGLYMFLNTFNNLIRWNV